MKFDCYFCLLLWIRVSCLNFKTSSTLHIWQSEELSHQIRFKKQFIKLGRTYLYIEICRLSKIANNFYASWNRDRYMTDMKFRSNSNGTQNYTYTPYFREKHFSNIRRVEEWAYHDSINIGIFEERRYRSSKDKETSDSFLRQGNYVYVG